MFIVKYPGNNKFIDIMKNITKELEEYKRSTENPKINYGDLILTSNSNKICIRYNINDYSGDIYFINNNSLMRLLNIRSDYEKDIQKDMSSYDINKLYKEVNLLNAILKNIYFDTDNKLRSKIEKGIRNIEKNIEYLSNEHTRKMIYLNKYHAYDNVHKIISKYAEIL